MLISTQGPSPRKPSVCGTTRQANRQFQFSVGKTLTECRVRGGTKVSVSSSGWGMPSEWSVEG